MLRCLSGLHASWRAATFAFAARNADWNLLQPVLMRHCMGARMFAFAICMDWLLEFGLLGIYMVGRCCTACHWITEFAQGGLQPLM